MFSLLMYLFSNPYLPSSFLFFTYMFSILLFLHFAPFFIIMFHSFPLFHSSLLPSVPLSIHLFLNQFLLCFQVLLFSFFFLSYPSLTVIKPSFPILRVLSVSPSLPFNSYHLFLLLLSDILLSFSSSSIY